MKYSPKYKLDTAQEPERLEDQSKTFNYSLLREFNLLKVSFEGTEHVLDAGCGTGLLGRQILQSFQDANIHVTGIDNSEFLLQRAKAENTKAKIEDRFTLSQQSLLDFNHVEKYSKIFCRYVMQHIPTDGERVHVIKNLLRALKPGGQIFLIDSFGIFSHVDTKNTWLREKIAFIEKHAPIDFNIGIKLRGFLIDCGIDPKDITVETLPFNFNKAADRNDEAKNWEQRFINAKPLLVSLLGESDAARFAKDYLEAFQDVRTLVLAQKILVKAFSKPKINF